MRYTVILIALALVTYLHPAVRAQTAAAPKLTVDQIYGSDELRPESWGPARWLDDGSGYTVLESAEEGGQSIVRYDASTGQRTVVVPAERLVPPGRSEPIEIADYQWSPDRRRVLLFTNTEPMWHYRRGDYWVVDRTDWSLRKLGGAASPASLLFATFSPAGNRVAYVRGNNIYVEDLSDGTITRLTHSSSDTIRNGRFSWAYAEEFFLRKGFRWSPDGASIAYWQIDTEGVGTFHLVNNTDSLYTQVIPIQYPKPGTTLSAARVGVVPADGGPTRWMDLPGDPHQHYIARMDWAASSEAIMMQYLNRRQNTNRVLLGDAQRGTVRTVLTERDSTWLYVNDVTWLAGGDRFLWISERDGWRRVYVVSRSGDDVQPVTPGAFDVISVERVDIDNGWLYYIASPDDPTRRYLYRTRLDGKGTPERLTPAGATGTHRYDIAPSARWAFHTYSSFGTPPQTTLIRLPQHAVERTLVDNEALRDRLDALPHPTTEFFRVDVDSVKLDAYLMKPADFDSTKTYPLLFYVYGEPWGQTVRDQWSGRRYLWHRMLAQQGYLVASVDNRGTRSPRGHAWRRSIYRQVGILASKDQAAAARQIGKRAYVDTSRIGIWGWSGGGSMTLNMLFRYPDLYETGMAVAPVPDQRYYNAPYQERYMGLPSDNAEGYRKGSPITFADQLQGNLLLVHGTGDDNVHYQGTEALINELIRADKQFSVMVYPNRSHGIYEGKNTRSHLFKLLTNYVHENLPPGPEAR